ncbi:MAG: hypothetical protein HFI98_01920 [Lachnospiraceae bacterium]|nr:hypothetical protein [Lachnospiraceae bacterium]
MLELEEKLEKYVNGFVEEDEEIYIQKVDNRHSLSWLKKNIPLLDCPNKILEKIYYFRWWTFRKHIKDTPEGEIITEFLPPVPWAGSYNSINCASGFHIREGRWLRDSKGLMRNEILFWLRGSGDSHSYSTWMAWAVWEYCQVSGDFEFGLFMLEDLIRDFEVWEKEHFCEKAGLFWSIDDRDCMECSISGSGFRPTLNSYMYANAAAISKIAGLAQLHDLEERFEQKAQKIKQAVQNFLWDGDFFKVIPVEVDLEHHTLKQGFLLDFCHVPKEHNVKELLGYIPWYFKLPDQGYEKAFYALKDPKVFAGKFGLRTADASHPRYKYHVDHECLWNGPVWPYATTQTLVALSCLLDFYQQKLVSKEDYYKILCTYAENQFLKDEKGARPWIDENLDGESGEWIARSILKADGWKAEKGGYERGKDYNHSMFGDLVITGLFGVHVKEDGEIRVSPKWPDGWDYCMLDGLLIRGHLYRIWYDRTGERYHKGAGLHIRKDGDLIL